MRLFFTDKEFACGGSPRPGVPFLADSQARLVDSANRYLYYVSCIRGRTAAPATWRTYGEHLYEFFSFLEENDLLWDRVGTAELAGWRNGMLGRGLTRTTCNARIRTVSAFYDWCQKSDFIEHLPFERETVRVLKPRGFLAHVDASGGKVQANELTLRTTPRLPKFLALDQAVPFIAALSPERTRLVAWLMMLCGLRREEAAGLDIRALPTPAGHNPRKSIKMTLDPTLTPTKGDRDRWVNLPYPLAGRLHDYLMHERPALARAYKKKHGHHSTKLFLTRFGEELSLDGLDERFRKASADTGIKCHPHMLRHTFAVHELVRMSGRPGINSLKWVADRLGHASISTTEIYIKAADLITHDELDGYVAEMLAELEGRREQ